jgi:hypothetical protein
MLLGLLGRERGGQKSSQGLNIYVGSWRNGHELTGQNWGTAGRGSSRYRLVRKTNLLWQTGKD